MFGRGLLGVAIAFAAYALIAGPLSIKRRDGAWVIVRPELLTSARRAVVAVAVTTGASTALLVYAFFVRDFSIDYVAQNTSRAAQPWYTLSALWSGMAGSLLLWAFLLSVVAALFVARRRPDREPFVPIAIAVLAGAEIFYLAIAFSENPFAASDVVPFDGRGMNPLLHSPGMLIHPPMLYTGLVGLSVPFAVAISALITNRTGPDWIKLVRRWMLAPWLFLGTGLVLGGAWAYTELGWGGYWAWDPVENAAFMPWLAATAFLHSAMVQERRGMLKVWNVFLVTTTAALATFGAFLTRSGLLSSVHAFAESPIGKWFFVYLAVQTIGGLALLVWRLPHLKTQAPLGSPVSKEATFLFNNLVFIGACAVVLWGTVLPLASEAVTGTQMTVGPPFFNRVMSPIGALLLLLSSFGTVVPWRTATFGSVLSRLKIPAFVATVVALATLVVSKRGDIAGVFWVATLLAATSVIEIVRARNGNKLSRTFARNPRRYGGYVVHLGVAVMVIGFAGSLGRTQTEVVVSEGETFSFAGFDLTYERLERSAPADKEVSLAVLDVSRDGRHLTTLRPQLNFHTNWDQPQSEIAIRSTPRSDLYVILAGIRAGSDEAVFRIHHNPLVVWVWTGAAIAVIGGLIALLLRPRTAALGPPTDVRSQALDPEHERALVDP
jgi:cytochrome c-type biogenesis protein CcmF